MSKSKEAKVIDILAWRQKNNIKPVYHWETEQQRRDWERENKQIEDAELIKKILKRGVVKNDD